jgi:hypothetical protein
LVGTFIDSGSGIEFGNASKAGASWEWLACRCDIKSGETTTESEAGVELEELPCESQVGPELSELKKGSKGDVEVVSIECESKGGGAGRVPRRRR